MAGNESEVRIRVTADVEQAERKLDEVEQKAEKVREAGERQGAASGGTGAAVAGGAAPAVPAGGGTPGGRQGTTSGGTGVAVAGGAAAVPVPIAGGMTPTAQGKFADAIGKNAGAAIGKYFIGQFGVEATRIAIEYTKKAGGGNRTQEYAQAGIGGAVGGATQGFIAGAMTGHPLGALAGGLIGAALGGGLGLAGTATQRKRDMEQRYRDRLWSLADAGYELEEDLRRQAFEGALQTMGTAQKAQALRRRAVEIRRGGGNVSVGNLSLTLANMELAGKSDTDTYAKLRSRLDAQLRAANAMDARATGLEQNARLSALIGGLGRSDGGFADSFAAQGIAIGSQVDAVAVQGDMLSELRKISQLLQKTAGQGGWSKAAGSERSYYGF